MIVTKIEKGSFLTSGLSTVTTIVSEINSSDSEAEDSICHQGYDVFNYGQSSFVVRKKQECSNL